MLPVDPVREPAQRREAFDALGGCGGRCVRHRHGRKGIDGDSAADGHPLRPHLPVRLFPRSRGAAVAALSRPDAHVAVSRISARRGSAHRLCWILYGHLCLDVPLESIRDDLPVSAARRVADGSRHHVRRTRCVRPFRCPHRIGDCRRVVVVDRGGVSPMADRRVSRCVVLHDAGALIELRSDRNRGRRRTADVFAADGLDHGRRRGSLWSQQSAVTHPASSGRDLCSGCGGRPRTGDDGTQRRTSVLADARGEDARAMAERRCAGSRRRRAVAAWA